MRHIVTFDADASPDEVAAEARAALRGVAGVASTEILSASEGRPSFCILIETEEGKDGPVTDFLKRSLRNNAEYLFNVSHRTFRKVG